MMTYLQTFESIIHKLFNLKLQRLLTPLEFLCILFKIK